MLTRRVSLLLLIASALDVIGQSLSLQGRTYCVGDSDFGDCPTDCTLNFEHIANILQSNSDIYFCAGRVEVNSLIRLQNVSNITIFGGGNSKTVTVLTCIKYGTGLKLDNVSEVTIKNVIIENCGSEHNSTTQSEIVSTSKTLQLSSAVYVINCRNLKLDGVHISNSYGIGLVLYDTIGVVEVVHSVFSNNSLEQNNGTFGGGGGVYVEFTICSPGEYCTDFENVAVNIMARENAYIFRDCTFTDNKAFFDGHKYAQYTKDSKRQDHQGLGRGGGLSIQLNGKSESNTFVIENCTFSRNEANWGGGLYIVLQDSSSHNSILLREITVIENKSPKYGGGGIDLGFNIATTLNNSVQFLQCKFINNRAIFGGGVRIYSSRGKESELQNVIIFRDCFWIKNTARFGSAIDIAPHVWEVLSSGFLPVPEFVDCEFRSNVAKVFQESVTNAKTREYQNGRGAMMLTKFTVIFGGLVTFVNNSGSAIYLSSSTITSTPQTICNFTSNSGFTGGAISFYGFSALFVQENNSFYFLGNTATRKGGAIYAYNIDKHNYVSSRSCFIQYHGSIDSKDTKNITFEFVNNTAGFKNENSSDCLAFGHSIFSSSLYTCLHSCDYYPPQSTLQKFNFNAKDTFKCVGEFTYSGSDITCQVSTSGGKFDSSKLDFQGKPYLEMYPGRELALNVSILNDFSQPISSVYYASLESHNNSNININKPYTYVSNKRMKLHGTPGSKGMLKLQKLGYREITLDIEVALIQCPPGYVLDKSNHSIDHQVFKKCVCSVLQSSTALKPIRECSNTLFQATLQKGYWLGYHENKLEYGYCPSGYCANVFNTTSVVPQKRELLDDSICGKYRTGRLCGMCKSNYSVHYHSIDYKCAENDSCKYGWLLYIISELLPLTVLFVITIVFNINFTSGAVNGFIWFAQVVHTLPMTGKAFIVFPNPVYHIYMVTKMIYNFFNFDFFSHNKLSFCLWRGATTMDMLVFKFVTVVYALLLVIVTVGLINYCNVFRRCKCKCLRFSTVKSSIIHGLSSVLVIVFSQCFKVCCQTLELAYIFGEGNEYHATVIFLQGNLTPFTGDHIKYAIPAVLCMLIMVIPMLLLLIYPLNFKLLKIVKCGDTNQAARCLCHTPYSKLKPFLDSFQSCFKDDYRVFAGLYFVYRSLIIFTTLIPRLTLKYMILDTFLVTFLLLHAICQPYRKRLHNIVDGLLFFNLIIINKISAYNYSYSKASEGELNTLPFTTTMAVILLNIPLVCMLGYILAMVICKAKSSIMKHTLVTAVNSRENNWEEFELPNRDEESDSEDECDYRHFGKTPMIPAPYPM